MRTKDIQVEVKSIALVHMDIEIDIERLMLDEFAGAERDLAIWLVQRYFLRFKKKLGPDAHAGLYRRALAESKYYATQRLTQLPGLIERSTLYMLEEARESNWFNDLEFDSLIDMLSNIYEDAEGKSTASDYKFLAETLMPTARSLNIDVDTIMGASLQTKKLRGAVPHARNVISRIDKKQITAEEGKKLLTEILEKVASPTISYETMKEELYELEGKVIKRSPPLTGWSIFTGEGDTVMMVIEVSSEKQRIMVEQALNGRIKFQITDVSWLVKRVNALFKKGDGHGI